MADGDRALACSSSIAIGLPTMLRAADDHASLPLSGTMPAFQQLHHAVGRAGDEARIALHQRADVLGVEAVDVLLRAIAFEHGVAVEVLRQRQLHQDAMHLRVGVEFGDPVEAPLRLDVGRILILIECACRPFRRRPPCCAHRPAKPGLRRPGSRPGRERHLAAGMETSQQGSAPVRVISAAKTVAGGKVSRRKGRRVVAASRVHARGSRKILLTRRVARQDRNR
jgi:hypothetical protein